MLSPEVSRSGRRQGVDVRVVVVPDVQETCSKMSVKSKKRRPRTVLKHTGAARLQLSVA